LNAILNPIETAQEFIRDWLNELTTDTINGATDLVGDVITSPFDLAERFPMVNDLISGMQWIGGAMLVLFFYQRLMQAMYAETVESDDVNYANIVGNTALGAGFIYSAPLLADKIQTAVADITSWVASFKLEYQTGEDFLTAFNPGVELAAMGLHMVIMSVIFALAFIGLAIAGGIRYALFYVGIIISPLVMATYPLNPGIAKNFFKAMLAIILTQPFQMLCLLLGLGVASYGGFWGLLVSTCFFGIGMFGTGYLKQFIVPVGVSSASTGALKMLALKMARR